MADSADHPENRGGGLRAGIGRPGRHSLNSATIEYEGGDHAGGARSCDPRGRTLLALIGDYGRVRAGQLDATTVVEGLGGRLDLVEQFVGVSVEWCRVDGKFHSRVLDGRGRRILAGQWGVTGADTGSDTPASLWNECHIALEFHTITGFHDS